MDPIITRIINDMHEEVNSESYVHSDGGVLPNDFQDVEELRSQTKFWLSFGRDFSYRV